jgi:tetratricopeptide (TPR) repeat protein
MAATDGKNNSPQEMDKQARYWQERGREDLAGEIQQKLQTLQTAQPARALPAASAGAIQQPPARLDNGAPAIALRPALETSLQNAPDSPDTRMHLAQIYRSAGEFHKARTQIESVLAARPDLPAALYASAQLYADQRLWREALDTLERISPVSRTQEMANLQKMAWAHIQLDRAEALVKQGRDAEAKVLLRRVALELSIDVDQPLQGEPPPLWKPQADARKNR